MEIFGFVLSVWAAIAIGIFFFAMVWACTADRHDREFPKWGVLILGIIVLSIWQWRGGDFSWRALFSPEVFKNVGIYLGIGVLYSGVEFFFKIRHEAREWGQAWERFKANRTNSINRGDTTDPTPLPQRFVEESSGRYSGTHNITRVALGENGEVEPTINRQQLAEYVGCWTLFWPAYAVSLALGDVLTEVCNRIADVLTLLSSRFVRRAFAKSFKP